MTANGARKACAIGFILVMWVTNARAALCRYVSSSAVIVTGTDSVPWPSGAVRIEVLGNDYETAGSPLSIESVSGSVGGTVVVANDGRGAVFTPAAGATSGSFQYRALSASGKAGTGQVTLGADPPPSLTASILANCTNLRSCTFASIPPAEAPDGIRAHSWSFLNTTTGRPQDSCRKDNVWAPNVLCDFTDVGTIRIFHSIFYYDGRVATNGTGTDILVQDPHDTDWKIDQRGLHVDVTIVHSKEIFPTRLWLNWGDGTETAVTMDSNGSVRDGKIVPHGYRAPGNFDVVLWRQKNGAQPEASASIRIRVENRAPIPSLTAQFDESSANTHLTWTVDDEFSAADELAPLKYEIDYGDGTSDTFGPTVMNIYNLTGAADHDYVRNGNYVVRLKVTDYHGAIGETSTELSIPSVRPKAAFTFSCVDLTCTFDASGSSDPDGGTIATYYWIFNTPTGPEPVIRSDAGPFQRTMSSVVSPTAPDTVELTVFDDESQASDKLVKRVAARKAGRAGLYYALNPCRLYDSRTPSTPWTSGPEHAIPVRGRCGIPDEAEVQSVLVGVAVLDSTANGSLWRIAEPELSTGTNYYAEEIASFIAGDRRAYTITLPVFAQGARIGLGMDSGSATAHVVIDVFGYFRAEAGAPVLNSVSGPVGPLRLKPLEQCIIRDTRTEPPALTSSTDVVWDLRRCGVTANSAAIYANVSAVSPATVGWLLPYPSALTTRPVASLSLMHPGVTESTGMVIRLSDGQTKLATMLSSLDVSLAVSGSFETTGLRFFELGRMCVAYSGRLTSLKPVEIQAGGNCGVPPNARAVLAKVMARRTDATTLGHIRLYPTGGNLSFATTIFPAIDPATRAPMQNIAIIGLGNNGNLTTMFQSFGGQWADAEVTIIGYFAE